MARAVYSELLVAELGLTGTATFTVPAGFRCVLRDLDAYNGGTFTSDTIFLHGQLGQAIWYGQTSSSEGSYHSWRGRQVIDQGLTFAVAVSGTWDVTVSGYLLTLP
jgi:hypothetical protein